MSTTVHFNTDDVSKLRVRTFSGSGQAIVAVPRKRKTTKDFFPRAQEHFSGYIKRENFEKRLAKIVDAVLVEMGEKHEKSEEPHLEMGDFMIQNRPDAGISPNLRPKEKIYPKKLNNFHHTEQVRQNRINKKELILGHLLQEDWNYFKKMRMADQIYEEGKKYERAAFLEAASFGASRILSSYFSPSKDFSKNPLVEQKFNNLVQATRFNKKIEIAKANISFTKGKIGFTKAEISVADFNPIIDLPIAAVKSGLDYFFDKVDSSKNQNNRTSKFQALDCMRGPEIPDTSLENRGVATSVSEMICQFACPASYFINPVRFARILASKKLSAGQKLGYTVSTLGKIGRFVSPHLNFGATFVNTVGNLLIADEYKWTGLMMGIQERENEYYNNVFFSRLTQDLYDDFNALNDSEIDEFIEFFRTKRQ